MQTEKPYWLDKAYATGDSVLDVGRAQRNVVTSMLCAHILGTAGLGGTEQCLDWGGAEGLFCRLMRDRGFNFFTYDKYIRSLYSIPYSTDDALSFSPAAITAFEVFEHLPEPATELNEIFALGPRFLLCTTELYERQGDDWMYLSLVNGRHVFFYSKQGMEWIARRFGYRYIQFPFVHAFVANEVWEKPALADVRSACEALAAGKDSLFHDAGHGLVSHLTGEAWRYIMADYLDIRRAKYGA